MIISSEIENVEKVENLIKSVSKTGKSILRAFARTRAKKAVQSSFKIWCLIILRPPECTVVQWVQKVSLLGF